MNKTCIAFSILGLGICVSVHAKDCDIPLNHSRPISSIEFVKSRFEASDFLCAIDSTQILAKSFATLPGRNGFDARFALREMALTINKNTNYDSKMRVALLNAAAISLAMNTAKSTEEVQADVRMFFNAGKEFQLQHDVTAELDMMAQAIRQDRLLPDVNRRISPVEIITPIQTEAYRHIDQLVVLAQLTRGDKILESFRPQLAFITYYDLTAWRQDDSRDVILERCRQLLRLTDALSDVTTCFGCVPEWHWKPLMQVGVAYQRLGMTAEAKEYIDQAIQVVHGIQNRDYRLGQYRFVLVDLLGARYSPSEIRSLAGEMMELANSLDTPLAKEQRASIPRTLKNWGIEFP